MTTPAAPASPREPGLAGQTVVVIGGSAGIGLETARRARAEGADVILTGRNPERLERAARDVGARRTAAFDAGDTAALGTFFRELPAPIDHVMVTAGGPHYGPLLEMDAAEVRDAISGHVVLALEVARNAAGTMRPGGTLLFIGGTGGRRVRPGVGIVSAATAALRRTTSTAGSSSSPEFRSPTDVSPACRRRRPPPRPVTGGVMLDGHDCGNHPGADPDASPGQTRV